MLKRIISVALMLCVCLTFASNAIAFGSEQSVLSDISETLLGYNEENLNITAAERIAAAKDGLEILSKITDPLVLQELVDNGDISRDEHGELPDYLIVYKTIEENTEASLGVQAAAATGISVTKTDYYDGRYFEEYDRYVVDGPSSFEQTYSRSSTASWNTNLTGNVTVGGTVFGVAEVKASVSSSMGYTIGSTYTKTSKYTVNIPTGKYWEIKIWTSYRVFTYTAKVGSTTIATGQSWYPNGLVILHTQYNK